MVHKIFADKRIFLRKYIISLADFKKEAKLTNYPLYMINSLKKYLSEH